LGAMTPLWQQGNAPPVSDEDARWHWRASATTGGNSGDDRDAQSESSSPGFAPSPVRRGRSPSITSEDSSRSRSRSHERGARAVQLVPNAATLGSSSTRPQSKPMPKNPAPKGSIGRMLRGGGLQVRDDRDRPAIGSRVPPPANYERMAGLPPLPPTGASSSRSRTVPPDVVATRRPPRPSPPDLRSMGLYLPKVAVFDLDQTCWSHTGLDLSKYKFAPPFRWSPDRDTVVDSNDRAVEIFSELSAVLLGLYQAGVKLAIASHDQKPQWCQQVMDAYVMDLDSGMKWGDAFDDPALVVIRSDGQYWTSKEAHLRDICEFFSPPLSWQDVLFFDDTKSIVKQAKNLGCTAVHVPHGVSIAHLRSGLQEHQRFQRGRPQR